MVCCGAGEHMHHGYYPQGAPPKSNAQAQIDMIEETLRWAGATSATSVSMAHVMLVLLPAYSTMCSVVPGSSAFTAPLGSLVPGSQRLV